jgi:hypothetical protein
MDKIWVYNWPSQTRTTCRVNQKPGWDLIFSFFFLIFNKLKNYKIILWILSLTYFIFFIVYIHIKCFLTFQYGIIIYNLHPHGMFLTFRCEVTIYNLNPYGLFLNFSTWDNYIWLNSHELFLKKFIWDKYTILQFLFYNLHSNKLFLNFFIWGNYITLHVLLFLYNLYSHVLFQNFFIWDIKTTHIFF